MEIIYENDDLLALNKPAGLLVHPTTPPLKHSDTLVAWVVEHYPSIATVGDDPSLRPGLVHRLDRDTSGLILVAKNQPSFLYLKNLFSTRRIKKTYLAVVTGLPKATSGIIDKPLGLKAGTTRRSVHGTKMIKPALTEYRLLRHWTDEQNQIFSLLEVKPLTGRTHQIRVHLSSIGHPIVGDILYNKKSQFSRLLLHSFSLSFNTADGTFLELEAPPPSDFNDFIPA